MLDRLEEFRKVRTTAAITSPFDS